MKAIILLGGLGTRLRPFTLEKPKPLLPILNKPFIGYQIDQLKRHGVREAVLALGFQAANFRRHLGDGSRWGMKFVYSLEKEPLGTGGAIRKALPHVRGTSLILNGDILSDVDFSALLRAHRAKKADGTLTLTPVEDPSRYGLIETGSDGRIRAFIEKPSATEMTVNTINAGFYVFEESVIRQIPADRAVSIEREVFPKLVKDRFAMFGFLHKGYWSDIGTLKSYWETHMDLLDRFAELARHYPVKRVKDGLWAGEGCRLHGTVKVQGVVVLGPRCRVAPNAVFRGRVSLGAGCVVGENVTLSDCVVQDGTRIGADTRLENCLIGARCAIGEKSHIASGIVLAGGSKLGPYSQQVSGLARETHANVTA